MSIMIKKQPLFLNFVFAFNFASTIFCIPDVLLISSVGCESKYVSKLVLSVNNLFIYLSIYIFIWNTLSKQRHPPKGGASNVKQQRYVTLRLLKVQRYTK